MDRGEESRPDADLGEAMETKNEGDNMTQAAEAAGIRERPILFSGEMVRAILAGRKTQTRRIVKPQPGSRQAIECCNIAGGDTFLIRDESNQDVAEWERFPCPYGKPGDRLWVRETWEPLEFNDREVGVVYSATPTEGTRGKNAVHWHTVGDDEALKWQHRSGKKFPGIHMPRWASRISLEITDVRVERLNEISEADAEAEGCEAVCHCGELVNAHTALGSCTSPKAMKTACDDFRELWESLNGPGSWDANPWAWVVSFKLTPAEE